MIKADIPHLARELNALAEVYDRRQVSAAALEVWFSTLREFPYEEIASTIIAWPRMRSKMPTPNDVFELVNDRLLAKREQANRVEKARYIKEIEALNRSENPQVEAIISGIRSMLGMRPRVSERELGSDDEKGAP